MENDEEAWAAFDKALERQSPADIRAAALAEAFRPEALEVLAAAQAYTTAVEERGDVAEAGEERFRLDEAIRTLPAGPAPLPSPAM